jgi:hypothetical protein
MAGWYYFLALIPVSMKASNLMYVLFPLIITGAAVRAQSPQSLKSILINHGESSCGNRSGEEQLFTNALSTNPVLLQACTPGLPFFKISIAYNPKYRKVYVRDSRNAAPSVLLLDYNFSGTMSCPVSASPVFTYNNDLNYFCFDEDGNNLTLSNYNSTTAQGIVKRIDFSTGIDIPGTAKLIDFPPGNAPGSFNDGDIENLPNGRVFAILGSGPTRLYELVNLDGAGNASAVLLSALPRNCYGIAFMDGNLCLAGFDGGGCYSYTWDINSNSLGTAAPFPLGKSSADMTNLNLGAGVAQELIGEVRVNANTADITYKVHLKNKGNCDLMNVQLQSRLTDVFGAGNVSNVKATFSENPAGLTLNPAFDGITDINLLSSGQILPNYPAEQDSLSIIVTLRATNLVINRLYLSSVIATGQLSAVANALSVIDSSNNGNAAKIDIDRNSVSDDAGEGIPTPYMFNVVLTASDKVKKKPKEANNYMVMYPNPFTDYISLKVNSLQKTQLRITIYDVSGRALKEQRTDLHPGENHIIVSGLQFLSKGTYILKTEDGLQTVQYKLIK